LARFRIERRFRPLGKRAGACLLESRFSRQSPIEQRRARRTDAGAKLIGKRRRRRAGFHDWLASDRRDQKK